MNNHRWFRVDNDEKKMCERARNGSMIGAKRGVGK